MKARFVEEIGTRGRLRIYWERIEVEKTEPCSDGTCPGGVHVVSTKWLADCPNSYGKGQPGVHNAYTNLGDHIGVSRRDAVSVAQKFGAPSDYPEERWPTHCEACGAEVPKDPPVVTVVGQQGFSITRQVFTERLYNTASGKVEPGDVFERPFHDPGGCPWWSNCDGTHTYGVLPNGWEWDMDSRASNCTMKEDRTHRCWVKTGSAKNGTLTVGKGGHTCSAGAGSIAAPGWHGFLQNFTWVG